MEKMIQNCASKSIYDYPVYYDILFGWNRDSEAEFYSTLFAGAGIPQGGKILEIACGTGQIAIRLALQGWTLTGLDICPEMLRFARERARSARIQISTVCADMAGFVLEELHDAAFCPMSSFRILADRRSAISHLSCTAAALRSGGVYILDMAYVQSCTDNAPTDADEWSMTRGKITVQADGHQVLVKDDENGQSLVLTWGESTRLQEYTVADFKQFVSDSNAFTVESWHPETGRDTNGISIFQKQGQRNAPAGGRTMVVLRKP